MARKRLPPQFKSFPSSGRHLLVVDQAPIRQRAVESCQAAHAELERLRELRRHFEERDRPAFLSWVHSTFHVVLGRIREGIEQIGEKEQLIEEVETLAAELGIPYGQAFRKVMKRRQAAEKAEKEARERAQERAENEGTREDFEFRSGWEERAEFGWEEVEASPTQKPASDILKRLYRELARKLHPDARAGSPGEAGLQQDGRNHQLWLQVQQAYEARDLKRLQALASLLEIRASQGAAGVTTVGELLDLAESLKKAIRSLKKELRQVEKDPAWGFSSEGPHQALKSRTRKELQTELRDVQETLHQLNEVIEVLFEAA